MSTDDLHRVLSDDSPIEPSAGFVDAVMREVLDGARAPRAIPFPWRRVAIAAAIGLAVAAAGSAAFVAVPFSGGALAARLTAVATHLATLSAAAALAASWLCVRFTRRFV